MHDSGYQLIGQRTRTNAKTPRRLRSRWILSEVLKNPYKYVGLNRLEIRNNRMLNTAAQIMKEAHRIGRYTAKFRKGIKKRNNYVNRYNKKYHK